MVLATPCSSLSATSRRIHVDSQTLGTNHDKDWSCNLLPMTTYIRMFNTGILFTTICFYPDIQCNNCREKDLSDATLHFLGVSLNQNSLSCLFVGTYALISAQNACRFRLMSEQTLVVVYCHGHHAVQQAHVRLK